MKENINGKYPSVVVVILCKYRIDQKLKGKWANTIDFLIIFFTRLEFKYSNIICQKNTM